MVSRSIEDGSLALEVKDYRQSNFDIRFVGVLAINQVYQDGVQTTVTTRIGIVGYVPCAGDGALNDILSLIKSDDIPSEEIEEDTFVVSVIRRNSQDVLTFRATICSFSPIFSSYNVHGSTEIGRQVSGFIAQVVSDSSGCLDRFHTQHLLTMQRFNDSFTRGVTIVTSSGCYILTCVAIRFDGVSIALFVLISNLITNLVSITHGSCTSSPTIGTEKIINRGRKPSSETRVIHNVVIGLDCISFVISISSLGIAPLKILIAPYQTSFCLTHMHGFVSGVVGQADRSITVRYSDCVDNSVLFRVLVRSYSAFIVDGRRLFTIVVGSYLATVVSVFDTLFYARFILTLGIMIKNVVLFNSD